MSSSRSSTAQSSSATDNRRVIGEGGVSAENSTVNVLDGGAINSAFAYANEGQKQAFSFGNSALDFGAEALGRAMDSFTQANTQAQDNIAATTNLVKDAYADAKGRGAMTDYMILAAVALMALVAWGAVKK